MSATATIVFVLLKLVDKVRLVKYGTCHLYSFKSMTEDLFDFVATNQATDIDERHVRHRLPELEGLLQELRLLTIDRCNHHFSTGTHAIL